MRTMKILALSLLSGLPLVGACTDDSVGSPLSTVENQPEIARVLEQSYADFSAAGIGSVHLQATVMGEFHNMERDHALIEGRQRAALEGYYRIDRPTEDATLLRHVPGTDFLGNDKYQPGVPLKRFVMLEVKGEIDSHPVKYDAFLVQYEKDNLSLIHI